MAYSTWHNYGFGIKTTGMTLDGDRIRAFIALAPEVEKAFSEYADDAATGDGPGYCDLEGEDLVDLFDEYLDEGNYGIAGLIAEIAGKTGMLSVYACDDFDSEQYLLYGAKYPWEMTQADLAIKSEADLKKAFRDLIKPLTDQSLAKLKYGPQSVENGG